MTDENLIAEVRTVVKQCAGLKTDADCAGMGRHVGLPKANK